MKIEGIQAISVPDGLPPNFVILIFFTKLSGINPYEKRINILGGHAWRHVLRLIANLKQWPST